MFELEQQIKAWRAELERKKIGGPDILDELESHLREEIAALKRSGMDEAGAFENAKSRFGDVESLRREFGKSGHIRRNPVTVIVGIWFAWVIAYNLFTLLKLRADPDPDKLLAVHIIALTVGYITACISGMFGICQVTLRLLNRLKPARRDALTHGLRTFNMLAAAFVLTGLVAGLAWNARHLGANSGAPPYPEVIAIMIVFNLREYGTYAVAFWLMATLTLQWRRPAARALVPMSIAGNLLVGLAWFGPFIFWDDLHSYSGIKTLWPANVIMILHLIFLGLSFVRRATPESNLREARN
jgi:hypothetical protein